MQQRQRQQLWCRRWWPPVYAWPPLALCLHVVMVESGMRAGMAVGCDSGCAMRSAECRQPSRRPRRARHCAQLCMYVSSLCFRCACRCMMLSSRTPDERRAYSDRKCIFCEYLRPFAARGEHAITRACVKARRFMVSQACRALRGPSVLYR